MVEIKYRCPICSPTRTDFLKPPEILYGISMMLKFYIGTDGDNLEKKQEEKMSQLTCHGGIMKKVEKYVKQGIP